MSEPTAAEREEQLVKLRRRMGRALRRGEAAEFDRLSAVYERLKGEHAQLVHEEWVAERWAAVVARRAEGRVERPERWRLPAGFGQSPLAAQRARGARSGVVVPDSRRPALSPWRRGSLMAEVIWRPPS